MPGRERRCRLPVERRPDLELRARAADHLVGERRRAVVTAQVGRADALGDRLERGLADRATGLLAFARRRVCASSAAAARIIAIGFATSLPCERRSGAVRGLGHQGGRSVDALVAERDEQRLRAGDRAEQRQHEIGKDVAVAVERRDHHRCAARRDEKRERRVDQLRLVRDVRVAFRGRVHLLLEHSLVDRADGVFRAAEHLRAHSLRLTERELRDRAADAPLDPLRAECDLVVAVSLAPLLGAVRVAHGHADDGDR